MTAPACVAPRSRAVLSLHPLDWVRRAVLSLHPLDWVRRAVLSLHPLEGAVALALHARPRPLEARLDGVRRGVWLGVPYWDILNE